jgi:predicted Ser/Thr protein kinase
MVILNLISSAQQFSKTTQNSSIKPPTAQTNQGLGKLSVPHAMRFAGSSQDRVEISHTKTPTLTAETAHASHYVDELLAQCNQHPTVERMTLRDFLVKAKLEPQRYLPTSSSYILDAFNHYDGPDGPKKIRAYGETHPQFGIMSAPWNKHLSDPARLYGQEPTMSRVWEILRAFKQQPNVDRGIAFFGPHGSGKSIIPKTIMAGLEQFSKQREGSLWTYSFVFPDGDKIKALPQAEADAWMEQASQGKRLIDPDKIAAQLMANLNLNPIFLLAPQARAKFLQSLKNEGKVSSDFNMDYYLKSNLDSHAQSILDKLHRLYSENPKSFQKHVQVERWTLSGQDFRGLVEVPASHNPEAVLRETSGEAAFAKAPELLRTMGQRTLDGLMPRAHRGIFYMDDFGRNGKPYDHLLMPLETGEVTLQECNGGPGITKELLDFVPMLSINPEVLEKARTDGNFDALEQRMLFVPVPCERRYKVEGQIMEPIINRAKARGKVITPDTLNAFSQWVTLTRMFPVDKNYHAYKEIGQANKDFASGISKLTSFGKALLYQGEMPSNLNQEEFKALDENLKSIANEHTQSLGETEFSLYEGGVGLSNRAATNMLKRITARPGNEPISFIDVFESIAHFTNNKPQYEQKRTEIMQEKNRKIPFQSGQELLKEVEDHTRKNFMEQLRTVLGVYQSPSVYVNRIQQYADHVEALRDGRMVSHQHQVESDPNPNQNFINNFETTTHPGTFLLDKDRQAYRSMFSTRAIDWNMGLSEKDNVQTIYKDEIERLKVHDEKLGKSRLNDFRDKVKVLVKQEGAWQALQTRPAKNHVEQAIKQLDQLGYPPASLPKILDWAVDNRYIADQVQVK